MSQFTVSDAPWKSTNNIKFESVFNAFQANDDINLKWGGLLIYLHATIVRQACPRDRLLAARQYGLVIIGYMNHSYTAVSFPTSHSGTARESCWQSSVSYPFHSGNGKLIRPTMPFGWSCTGSTAFPHYGDIYCWCCMRQCREFECKGQYCRMDISNLAEVPVIEHIVSSAMARQTAVHLVKRCIS